MPSRKPADDEHHFVVAKSDGLELQHILKAGKRVFQVHPKPSGFLILWKNTDGKSITAVVCVFYVAIIFNICELEKMVFFQSSGELQMMLGGVLLLADDAARGSVLRFQ